ncbi:MAG: hypothetical protein HC924_04025 [Synechococcaceae cyanobacterium SM2_3_2]|nr:hypothetical protein [Synechococcaceae cyanobacterium SM2_3_2]
MGLTLIEPMLPTDAPAWEPILSAAPGLTVGSGVFVHQPRQLKVWYHLPWGLSQSAPIVFVMHGVNRNAQDYRDDWITYANQGRFLLLVPEFSAAQYPDPDDYNLGHVFADSGQINPVDEWSFSAIEDIFAEVQQLTHSTATTYNLYGHSAGAQFVHRLVMLMPQARVGTAIAANAGWYLLPTLSDPYPYGLGRIPDASQALATAFGRDLVILLGSEDTDPDHQHLNRGERAMSQGSHRLARGQFFFEQARAQAAVLNLPFDWRIQVVPGVGHSNSGMADVAAKLLSQPGSP